MNCRTFSQHPRTWAKSHHHHHPHLYHSFAGSCSHGSVSCFRVHWPAATPAHLEAISVRYFRSQCKKRKRGDGLVFKEADVGKMKVEGRWKRSVFCCWSLLFFLFRRFRRRKQIRAVQVCISPHYFFMFLVLKRKCTSDCVVHTAARMCLFQFYIQREREHIH